MKPLLAGFLLGATTKENLPEHTFPEITFVGRSNVGKSSLLNSLVQQKNLAHVSQTPGKTQQINFYPVESRWMFVDLPGFGYAKVSQTERAKWKKLNMWFLLFRKNVALICVLIDSRHDPQKIDMEIIESLENAQRPYIIVLTKVDKLKAQDRKDREEQVRHLINQCVHCEDVIPYSIVEKIGRVELIGAIKRMSKDYKSTVSNTDNNDRNTESKGQDTL